MALDRKVPTSATLGTITGDSYMDQVAEEILALWNGSVIALTGIGGSANVITASLVPDLDGSLADGMMFLFMPAATNTGATTLLLNAGSTVEIVSRRGSSFTGGELASGMTALIVFESSSGKHRLLSKPGSEGLRTYGTDAPFTLTPDVDASQVLLNGAITADRICTLSTTGAVKGDRFDITRSGAGAFNWSIGGLIDLAVKGWCRVAYDGAAWNLMQAGTLP